MSYNQNHDHQLSPSEREPLVEEVQRADFITRAKANAFGTPLYAKLQREAEAEWTLAQAEQIVMQAAQLINTEVTHEPVVTPEDTALATDINSDVVTKSDAELAALQSVDDAFKELV